MQQKNECGNNERFNPQKSRWKSGRNVTGMAANDNLEILSGELGFADPENDNEAPADGGQEQYSAFSPDVIGNGVDLRSGQLEEDETYMVDRPDDEHGIQELDFSEKSISRRGFLSEDIL